MSARLVGLIAGGVVVYVAVVVAIGRLLARRGAELDDIAERVARRLP